MPDNKFDRLDRFLCEHFARKISGLPKAVISQLSDDEAYGIIEAEFSRLPQAELNRIVEAEVDIILAPFVTLLSLLFPKKDKQITPPPPLIEDQTISPQLSWDWGGIFYSVALLVICGVGSIYYTSRQPDKRSLSKSHVIPTADAAATAQEVKQRAAVVPNTSTGIYSMVCKLQGVEHHLVVVPKRSTGKEKQIE